MTRRMLLNISFFCLSISVVLIATSTSAFAQDTGIEENFFTEDSQEILFEPNKENNKPSPSKGEVTEDVAPDATASDESSLDFLFNEGSSETAKEDSESLKPKQEEKQVEDAQIQVAPKETISVQKPTPKKTTPKAKLPLEDPLLDTTTPEASFTTDDPLINENSPDFDDPDIPLAVETAEPKLERVEKRKNIADVTEGNTEIQANKETTVIVEPSNAVRIDYQRRRTVVVPYSQRRKKWGSVHGLSAGTPSPDDFEPNFITADFSEVYGGSAKTKIIEYHSNYKRNFGSFSLGIEFNIGTYGITSNQELIDSFLQVTYAKLGGQIALDNMFANNPYIVPYTSGGIYTILYTEEQGSTSNNGNTEVSFYGSGGLMIDIGWLDRMSANDAYFESGIENTFLFAEATFLAKSSNEKDPNFEGLNLNAGIKVEF